MNTSSFLSLSLLAYPARNPAEPAPHFLCGGLSRTRNLVWSLSPAGPACISGVYPVFSSGALVAGAQAGLVGPGGRDRLLPGSHHGSARSPGPDHDYLPGSRRYGPVYSRQCGVPVTAQRLRHTFASQMLTAGMPVSSLQRYLGHVHLDTTMIYAEVSDPLLRQDYYQGITALDPGSEKLALRELAPTQQHTIRQLVEELKTPGLEQSRRDEILDMILTNLI